MKIKLDNKEIGTAYCNMQLKKAELGKSHSEVLRDIKESGFKVALGDKEISIKSFRTHWLDREFLYLEGAEFEVL